MDDLYDLINAFTHWRMLLATALAVALATLLTSEKATKAACAGRMAERA